METIEKLTNEVVEENKKEIKKLLFENIKKAIAQTLVDSWSSPIKKQVDKATQKALKDLFTDDEIKELIAKEKQTVLDGFQTAMQTISLKTSAILYEIFIKKMANSWDRDKLFAHLFDEE
ncbi:hypothetical protein DRQ26_02935 [bacterium]|nr:MAG: hypothetical protein DRQ26_02935 [bacterium]